MRRLQTWLPALCTAAVAWAVCVQLPFANGPREWQWAYRPPGLDPAWAGLAAGLALLIVWRGGKAAAGGSPAETPGRFGLAAACTGAALSLAVLGAQAGGFARVTTSLVSPQVFGYVFDAAVAPPSGDLLADYPAASAGLSMHARTHPPGPLLAVRALDSLVRMLPMREPAPGDSGALATARDAFEDQARRARDHRRPAPQQPPSAWTLLALACLLPALGALAAWPLHRLALDWGLGAEPAAFAVALWLLVPARTLFTPSLDQALPLLLLVACLGARRGTVLAVAAGALLWVSSLLSYGCLPWIPLVCLLSWLGTGAVTDGAAFREAWRWRRLAATLGGFFLPVMALQLATGFDAIHSARVALEQHRAMAVATRGYATWLLWNPYDFALLLGPGVLLLALFGFRRGALPVPMRWPAAALAALLAALWLSGGVRGEVGRIWIFLMPFACLLGAAAAPSPLARRLLLTAQAALLLALAGNLIFVS